jgi:hypoxanthine phosphoribosyltransferase
MEKMPETLFSEDQIQQRIKELGAKINIDYENQELVVICVLKGAFVFCADLVRQIQLPVSMEFVQVSSYGDETTSSGQCQLLLDLSGSIEGKNVLIVEDIIDTGLTMKYLKNLLQARNPKSIKVASLLYKPSNTVHETTIDYLAFEIEDKFVIGYGLDYAGLYRELPYIGVLNADF